MSLGDVFDSLASARRSTRRLVKSAERARFVPQEETLTEFLLTRVSRTVDVELHTRHRESRTSGADWEWWWTDGGLWVGMLVQAKRWRPLAEPYHFGYTPKGSTVRQIDRLQHDASRRGLAPVYVVYNVNGITPPATGPCQCTRPESLATRLSVAVIPASVAATCIPGSDRAAAKSFPIECLACPLGLPTHVSSTAAGAGAVGLPQTVLERLRSMGVPEPGAFAVDAGTYGPLSSLVVEGRPQHLGRLESTESIDALLEERELEGIAIIRGGPGARI